MHLGKTSDGSSHEGNGFAIKHGAYADRRTLYTDVFTDAERELVREVFGDYLEDYRNRYSDPPLGIVVELFAISINTVTEIRASNWCADRPDDVDTGFPHVDREERVELLPDGDRVTTEKYKLSPALKAEMSISRETRLWLRDLGLLSTGDESSDTNTGDRDTVCGANQAELEDVARDLLADLDSE